MTLKMWTHTILTLLFLNFDRSASPEFSSLQIEVEKMTMYSLATLDDPWNYDIHQNETETFVKALNNW